MLESQHDGRFGTAAVNGFISARGILLVMAQVVVVVVVNYSHRYRSPNTTAASSNPPTIGDIYVQN